MRLHALWFVALSLLVAGCNNNVLPPTASSGPFDAGALTALVGQAARDNGVPAPLLYAMLETESSGNPAAVSRDGAMGLMQLMPATAAQCGLRNPFDPHGNLECGASYLAQMLTRFSNNVSLAVAAYNAGPNAVLRAHGIPNARTERYVQEVLARYHDASAFAPAP